MVNVDTEEVVRLYCVITDSLNKSKTVKLTHNDVIDIIPKLNDWLEQYDARKEELQEIIDERKSISKDSPFSFEFTVPTSLDSLVDKYKGQVKEMKYCKLPEGFTEFDRSKEPGRNGEIHTYVYANDAKGVYGFKVLNGKESQFRRLGSVTDPTSSLGQLLRKMPNSGQQFIKGDLQRFKIKNLAHGSRMKAAIHILEYMQYIKRTGVDPSRRRAIAYYRTNKRDGLEGESNGQTAVSSNPTELKIEPLKPFKV